MNYSEWQLNRIRNALRAFRQYTHVENVDYYNSSDDKNQKNSGLIKSFTWADVREAIAISTGVEIGKDMKKGAERLRQFVEGINDKENPGKKKFPVPQSKWLDAIVTFLVDEENDLLSENELKEHAPQYQALMRLLEYLDQDFDNERLLPPEKIKGAYEIKGEFSDRYVIRELTLESPSTEGLIRVNETTDYYDVSVTSHMEQWTHVDRKNNRDSQVVHNGWAILTPEGNLFFFLKNNRNGMNRYYLTMVADNALWNDAPQIRLILLVHDFPLELEEQDREAKQIMNLLPNKIAENVMFFTKKE